MFQVTLIGYTKSHKKCATTRKYKIEQNKEATKHYSISLRVVKNADFLIIHVLIKTLKMLYLFLTLTNFQRCLKLTKKASSLTEIFHEIQLYN